jgi:hypothetical protein
MFDAEHWVLVAEQVTKIAQSMESADGKRTMLAVAADYLKLADRAKHIADAAPAEHPAIAGFGRLGNNYYRALSASQRTLRQRAALAVIDPLLPFKIGPMNGEDARETGLFGRSEPVNQLAAAGAADEPAPCDLMVSRC